MVVRGSQQETLNLRFVLPGTRHQGVPVILRKLMLPNGIDPVSPSLTTSNHHFKKFLPIFIFKIWKALLNYITNNTNT
ncbi:unnamed protein product [Schistosoma margrebowiei]|uniref:Uncharacterized protein n=1 Tax=Schistosoma margrebowiei TaxID=48269 RepID=A0A183MUP6_9TREM|nr:unnamed protein product [Schistosoma margrebowiei]